MPAALTRAELTLFWLYDSLTVFNSILYACGLMFCRTMSPRGEQPASFAVAVLRTSIGWFRQLGEVYKVEQLRRAERELRRLYYLHEIPLTTEEDGKRRRRHSGSAPTAGSSLAHSSSAGEHS